jgi:hypothetical protein
MRYNKKTTPVRYSFAKDEKETASITFLVVKKEAVYFQDFEGTGLPEPEDGTHWENTILFPAGIPFKLNVKTEREGISSGELRGLGQRNSSVAFECPPLEAGEEYQLRYNYRFLISDQLILTNVRTKKIIHTQTFYW